jgi:ArsR family transcriptional regulator
MSPTTTARPPAIDRLEAAFKALADATRLRILALLGENEVCVCHIHDSLGLPQPTVSRHLAYLRRAGLVRGRRDGVLMHYRLAPSIDPAVQRVLDTTLAALRELRTTSQDRKQFERSFGELYVCNSPEGGACCAPRT